MKRSNKRNASPLLLRQAASPESLVVGRGLLSEHCHRRLAVVEEHVETISVNHQACKIPQSAPAHQHGSLLAAAVDAQETGVVATMEACRTEVGPPSMASSPNTPPAL